MAEISLMIGTNPRGQGGIAEVVKFYRDTGLFEANNMRYLSSHWSKYSKPYEMYLYYAICIAQLLIVLVLNRVRFIHVHTASRGSYQRKSLIMRITRFFKVPVIIHLHGGEFQDFYTKECSVKRQERIRDDFILASRVLVLTEKSSQWLKSIGVPDERIVAMPNSIIANPQMLETEQSSNDEKVLLFLGKLTDLKGVTELIKAFKKVCSEEKTVRLLLAGTGEMEKYEALCKELEISQYVTFPGWVAGNEKNELIKSADIFLLPSHKEAFPISLLEAMYAEVPIIATPVGAVSEMIEDGVEGRIVPVDDEKRLAEAMLEMLRNPEKASAFASAAKNKFLASYSADAVIGKLQNVYDDIEMNL